MIDRAKATTGINVTVAGIALLCALFMVIRSLVRGTSDIFPSGYSAALAYVASGSAIFLGFNYSGLVRRRALRYLILGVTYCLAGTIVAVAWARLPGAMGWTPGTEVAARGVNELTGAERAKWGLQVAVHRLTGGGARAASLPVQIPDSWPFPTDVEIAATPDQRGSRVVWSRTSDQRFACMERTIDSTDDRGILMEPIRCDIATDALPPNSEFSPIRRGELPITAQTVNATGGKWLQYRHDGARTAASDEVSSGRAPWRAFVFGELRSAVSAAGGMILVGAHGTGSLEAFDVASGARRWRTRVPNWIHEDAVSDGSVVAVGFGDNNRSALSRSPAGVAAYDLLTGTLRWTAFERTSVMSSPVISDSSLVYGTQGGWLRKRRLSSGTLLAQIMLHGTMIMAPPAVLGDTLVASLERNHVCAVLISTLKTLWCREIAKIRSLGHAGPAIGRNKVIISGVAPMHLADWIRELRRIGPVNELQMFVDAVLGPYPAERGQQVVALSLVDGHTLWRSEFFPRRRRVIGHLSGTATIDGSVGVIVLPVADLVVMFDLEDGRVRWSADADGSRGPPLVMANYVIVAGSHGVVRALDLENGTLRCAVTAPAGFDRAGPSLVDGLVVFSRLDGGVDAVPREMFDSCDKKLVQLFSRRPSGTKPPRR